MSHVWIDHASPNFPLENKIERSISRHDWNVPISRHDSERYKMRVGNKSRRRHCSYYNYYLYSDTGLSCCCCCYHFKMNINYNSEESYGVKFFRRNTTIEEILSLKTNDFENKKPGEFYIDERIDWDHATLGAFLDVLYYFKERRIQWKEFVLRFHAKDQSFTSVLLQTVNGLNIFKKMELRLFFYGEEDVYSADCEYLFPGIKQNKQLESLHVGIGGTHRDRFEDDFTSFVSHLQEMTTLKELKLWCMPHFNQESFSEGLRENKSLEKLHLDFQFSNDIADEGISNIVTSLASHPKLEKLYIGTNDDRNEGRFGDLSSKAIEKLLSKTQTLTTLSLPNFGLGDNRGLNTECIVQGLKKNQTIKSLKTLDSLYGDLMLSRFFQILPHCPNLQKLELTENSMTRNDLENVIHMDRLERPIVLEIHDDVVFENTSVMTELLRCHPEVRPEVNDAANFEDNIELQNMWELNWHGRYMIDGSTKAPLSLWPRVFEIVNNSGVCDDKPSVIYEFLKGPAFAGRDEY